MAKKVENPKTINSSKTASAPAFDLFERMESFLHRNSNTVFWSIFILSLLLVFGLFEMKIGLANDDALYIEGGVKYARDFFGYFFTANAPLYPMLLGLVISLFGSSLVILKLVSSVFFLLSIFLIFKAFKGRLPYSVLFPAIFITATNALFLINASLTYTECFFASIQALFLWFFLKITDEADANSSFASTWKLWLIFGLSVFLMFTSRNVSIGILAVIPVFFLLKRQWKYLGIAFLVSVSSVALWMIVKKLIWPEYESQFGSQLTIMMRKSLFNPQDPNNGPETPLGFVKRFLQNTEIYFYARFWELLGYKKDNSAIELVKMDYKLLFGTIFTILLMIPGAVFAYIRKNNAVMVSFLYFIILSSVTFISLHTSWAQSRLVMIYFPFIFMTIFYGFWELFKTKRFAGLKFLYFILLAFLLLPNLYNSLKRIPDNIPVLSKNISGDEFYGYTNDWKNFFKASRWCARELPEGSYVASRRAPMSFIYGDFKDFYPVYSIPSENPDTLLSTLKRENVTHVLLAELRVNPKRYIPNRYINTLHRYVSIIAMKYPTVFQLVHKEGTQEVAEVYKINYELAVPQADSALIPNTNNPETKAKP